MLHTLLVTFIAIASLTEPLFAMEKEIKPVILLRDMPQEIKDDTKNILTFIHNNPLVFPEEIKNIIKDQLIISYRLILLDLFKDYRFKSSIELQGHTGEISSVAFSPDGKFALTGSYDTTARLWNLKDLSSKELKGHTSHITSVAFSPDGKFALTGTWLNTARLWNLKDFSSKELQGQTGGINSIRFSPDGNIALTGSEDKTARLLNLKDLSSVELNAHTGGITSVAFSPEGEFALTGSWDDTARLWNLKNLSSTMLIDRTSWISSFTQKTATGPISSVAFSPDGKFALTGSWDHTARLWKLYHDILGVRKNDNFLAEQLNGHTDKVSSVAFSPDGNFALTGSEDKTARFWNLKNLSSVELNAHTGRITSVAFSPDGNSALTGSCDRTARLWKLWPDLTLTLDQIALIAKLDHLTKGNVNPSFLFFEKNEPENFYVKVLKSFDEEVQKAIANRFKLSPRVLNLNSDSCCLQ